MRKIFTLCAAACMLTFTIGELRAQSSETTRYRGGNFFAEAGGLVGVDKIRMSGGSVTVGGGYTFNKHLFVGAGATLNLFGIEDLSGGSFPIFARIKYSVMESKITPYLSLDLGYDPMGIGVCYEISPDYTPKDGDTWIYGTNPGFYWRPELGVSYRLKKRRALHLGIGYCQQLGDFVMMKQTATGDVVPEERNTLNELTFRIGFTL